MAKRRTNEDQSALSGGLKGGGVGASVGGGIGKIVGAATGLGPIAELGGAALGAGIGGIFGAGAGSDEAKRLNQENAAAEAEAQAQNDRLQEAITNNGLLAYQNRDVAGLGPSAFESIQVDPRYAAAENESLAEFKARSSAGITPGELARYRQAQIEQERVAAGAQGAQTQLARARGAGPGSGAAMVQKQMVDQNRANVQAGIGNQAVASANDRSNQFIQKYGDYASSLQNKGWNQQAQVASARDQIARFNNENERANITRQLQTTGLNNENARYNTGLKVSAIRNPIGTDYSQADAMRQQNQDTWNSIGTAAAGAKDLMASGAGMINDDKLKKAQMVAGMV